MANSWMQPSYEMLEKDLRGRALVRICLFEEFVQLGRKISSFS